MELRPDHIPGLLAVDGMELELEQMLGRPVDLRAYGDLSRYFRDQVRADAQELQGGWSGTTRVELGWFESQDVVGFGSTVRWATGVKAPALWLSMIRRVISSAS